LIVHSEKMVKFKKASFEREREREREVEVIIIMMEL
jgi:hypothetical protein